MRLGYLSADELVKAVQRQVEYIIESLFILEDGRFEFEEMPLPNEEVITLKLSAANLIYRGTKKINSMSRIKRSCRRSITIIMPDSDPAKQIYGGCKSF